MRRERFIALALNALPIGALDLSTPQHSFMMARFVQCATLALDARDA
jgi:hypothetical protein